MAIEPKRFRSKVKGSKFERTVRHTILSGSLPTDPGDLSHKVDGLQYCVEVKQTDKKGFRITTEMVDKLWHQSLDVQKIPKLVIGIPHKSNDKVFMLTCFITVERKQT